MSNYFDLLLLLLRSSHDLGYVWCAVTAAEILCVETVVNPLELYYDVSESPESLDEIKLLLTIRSAYDRNCILLCIIVIKLLNYY